MALIIEINNTPYRIYNDLDIPIGQFVKVFTRTKNQPAQLTELQQLELKFKNAETDEEKEIAGAELLEGEERLLQHSSVLRYYLDIISLLSDIPRELLELIPTKQFWQILGLCNGLFAAAEIYQPSVPDYVEYKGEKWLLIDKHFEKQDIASHIKAQLFAENADSLAGGHYESMMNIIALILHKEGEVVTLDIAESRTDYFNDLPLRDALDIAFFLRKLQRIYQIRTGTYSVAQMISAHKKEKQKRSLGGRY